MILYFSFFPEDEHAPVKSPILGFQIGSMGPFLTRFWSKVFVSSVACLLLLNSSNMHDCVHHMSTTIMRNWFRFSSIHHSPLCLAIIHFCLRLHHHCVNVDNPGWTLAIIIPVANDQNKAKAFTCFICSSIIMGSIWIYMCYIDWIFWLYIQPHYSILCIITTSTFLSNCFIQMIVY